VKKQLLKEQTQVANSAAVEAEEAWLNRHTAVLKAAARWKQQRRWRKHLAAVQALKHS
jgi:hypothetical protein